MKIRLRDKESFAELLIRKGFTKRALATAAGIGQPTLVQISNGIRRPSPTTAKRILDTLGVEFDDIFVIEKEGVTCSA